jgi:hypothetical protein
MCLFLAGMIEVVSNLLQNITVKKSITILLIGSLVLIPLQLSNATAPKAGATCQKLNTTQIYSSFKFTCVKSGKKLVWSKGVPAKVTIPVPTPTTSPAPLPEPVPTRTPVATPSPTPTLNFIGRWNALGSLALQAYGKAFPEPQAKYPKADFVWRTSDTLPEKIKTEISNKYSLLADFWSRYTGFTKPTQVIIAKMDEIDFICKWRDSYLGFSDQNCKSSFRPNSQDLWQAHTTYNNGLSTDFFFISDPESLTLLSFIPRVEHEFFHDVQHAQSNSYKTIFPCWADESAAEYFGDLVASRGDAEKFIKLRNYTINKNQRPNTESESSVKFWKDWLLAADIPSILPGSNAWACEPIMYKGLYNSGILAPEYLNLKLGIAGVLALYKDAGTMGWDTAIEKAFSKSKSAVYDDIAAYMDQEYRIANAATWARPRCDEQCKDGL